MDKLRVVLPENTGGILAAVSGGADSVAMLWLLREACEERSIRLTAAHFEHGIRAEASVADAAFVRKLCRAWNVELIEGGADVPSIAKARSVGIEEAARDARYAFLRQAKRQAGADLIALAHHRDDQVETVLMHLLRGCGLKGLTGMREKEGDLYRPLLDYPKQTLVDLLLEQGIEWREDATNQISDTPRNALRLNVIPQIEACYPAAKRAICRLSQIAKDENDFIQQETDRFLISALIQLPFGWLVRLDSEVHHAVLMRALHQLTGAEYEAVLRAAMLCEGEKGGQEIDGRWKAERGRLGLYLIEKRRERLENWEYPLPEEGCLSLGEAGMLSVGKGSGAAVKNDPFCQELNGQALRGAVVRTRRRGDRIHPLGAPGRQKLKEYFINRRIDRPLRDIIPVIARGSDVLWVPGEGIAEEVKLTTPEDAVRLTLSQGILELLEIKQAER